MSWLTVTKQRCPFIRPFFERLKNSEDAERVCNWAFPVSHLPPTFSRSTRGQAATASRNRDSSTLQLHPYRVLVHFSRSIAAKEHRELWPANLFLTTQGEYNYTEDWQLYMRLWLVKESKKKCSKIEKRLSPVDSELSLSMSKIAHDLLDSKEDKSSFFSDKRRRVVDCYSFSSQLALGWARIKISASRNQ